MKVCTEDVMLHYPDFKEGFDIYTESSNFQMGAIISQNHGERFVNTN